MGLMQIMPDLASDMKLADPFDPEQNVEAGVRYLGQLMERYGGDLRLALAAYNAGPARVDISGGVPDIEETKAYVSSILRKVQP
jgi:soluble lytic murein transglycosylase-like protein